MEHTIYNPAYDAVRVHEVTVGVLKLRTREQTDRRDLERYNAIDGKRMIKDRVLHRMLDHLRDYVQVTEIDPNYDYESFHDYIVEAEINLPYIHDKQIVDMKAEVKHYTHIADDERRARCKLQRELQWATIPKWIKLLWLLTTPAKYEDKRRMLTK